MSLLRFVLILNDSPSLALPADELFDEDEVVVETGALPCYQAVSGFGCDIYTHVLYIPLVVGVDDR